MSKEVCNISMGFQSRFLWGRDKAKQKIAWVSWEDVCKSKKLGGLGLKYLKVFNEALLGEIEVKPCSTSKRVMDKGAYFKIWG